MPITIEYQPDLALAGQVSHAAGRGRFLQSQDQFNLQQSQLGEQQRQFDARMLFSGKEAALRDAQHLDGLYQDDQRLRQQDRQFGAEQYNRMLAQQQHDQTQLQSQQMQQQGYAERAQQQLAEQAVKERAANYRLEQTQQFENAAGDKKAIQDYIAKNASVLSEDSIASLRDQWQQTYGMPFSFDESAALQKAQASEDMQRAQMSKTITESFVAPSGKPLINPDLAPLMFGIGENGQPELNSFGEEVMKWAHGQVQYEGQAAKAKADFEREELKVGAKQETEQQKAEQDREKDRLEAEEKAAKAEQERKKEIDEQARRDADKYREDLEKMQKEMEAASKKKKRNPETGKAEFVKPNELDYIPVIPNVDTARHLQVGDRFKYNGTFYKIVMGPPTAEHPNGKPKAIPRWEWSTHKEPTEGAGQ